MTTQKFNKAAIIEALEFKIVQANEQHVVNLEEYEVRYTEWVAEKVAYHEARIAELLDLTNRTPGGYDTSRPSPPINPETKLVRALAQVRLMDGDVVSLNADDDLLKLVL
jgi:hypothetical protein